MIVKPKGITLNVSSGMYNSYNGVLGGRDLSDVDDELSPYAVDEALEDFKNNGVDFTKGLSSENIANYIKLSINSGVINLTLKNGKRISSFTEFTQLLKTGQLSKLDLMVVRNTAARKFINLKQTIFKNK